MSVKKLSDGHSVVFIVPEEIETNIPEATAKAQDRLLTAADVLGWIIQGTWTDLRRSMPLWVNQGATFAKQLPRWNAARTN